MIIILVITSRGIMILMKIITAVMIDIGGRKAKIETNRHTNIGDKKRERRGVSRKIDIDR